MFKAVILCCGIVLLCPWRAFAGEVPKHIKLQQNCFLKNAALCQHWYQCQRGKGQSCFRVGSRLAGGIGVKRDVKKAHVLMQRGCQFQYGPACTGLALLFAQGWGKGKDLKTARTLYHRACKLKHAIGCGTLGLYYMRGVGGPVKWKEARYAFQQACALGNGMGCHNAGLFYELGKQVKRSPSAARHYYQQGCQQKYGRSCYNLGAYHYQQYRSSQTDAKASKQSLAAFQKFMLLACRYRWGMGCRQLGLFLAAPSQPHKHRKKALAYLSQACGLGDAEGCYQFGRHHTNTSQTPPYKRVVQGYQRACQLRHPIACNELGAIYRQGYLGAPNLGKAKDAFQRACSLRNHKGCYNLGVIYISQKPTDYQAARQAFQRACQENSGVGCFNLGALWLKGWGGPRSNTRAQSFFQQACNHGFQPGCRASKSNR